MISEDGTYKTAVLGNPLERKGAQFLVFVPTATYNVFESLSNDEATFHSYLDIPGMLLSYFIIISSVQHLSLRGDGQPEFSVTKMADLFPKYRGMFQHLAKPGYHGDYISCKGDSGRIHDEQ